MNRSVNLPRLCISRTVAATLLATAGLVAQAGATPISASSSAYGEASSLTLTALVGGAVVGVGSGPLPTAAGTAPGAYSQTGTAASASITGLLSTGVLNVSASSNVTGSAGSGITQASSTVNNLTVALATLLGINASSVLATVGVNGDYGSLAATGATTISGLSINGLAAFATTITPTINDIVLNAGGIEVTLNKQVSSVIGGTPTITVDGIAIDFANVLTTMGGTTGYLNGELDIASSTATMAAAPNVVQVPEPSGLAVFALGLGSVAFLRRKASYC